MCKAVAAANFIVNQTNMYNNEHPENTIYMYAKRLQKLLYFSELRYMEKYNKKLFSDDFEAWPNGPVIRDIYDRFRVYQSGVMDPITLDKDDILNKREKDCISEVLNLTNDMNVFQLIDISHDERGPWPTCYENRIENGLDVTYQVISKESMLNYIHEVGFYNLFNRKN